MKKILFSLIIFTCFTISSLASHITGGEMYYTLVSQSGNNYTYQVTLKLFRDPGSGAGLDASAAIAIFDKGTNVLVVNQLVPMTSQTTITLTNPGACIVNPPIVSYNVGFYTFNITLPGTLNGYLIAYQRCCRVATLANVTGSGNIGATYTAEIPGSEPISSAPANNSAHFLGQDTVVICSGYNFSYNFSAVDPDGDLLTYSFCNAYIGGASGSPAPNPPASPPYSAVPYTSPYTSSFPMGPDVNINSTTGVISGIAPAAGTYVVTVCIQEKRNGVVIATQRKDLQIKVADCDIATVTLEPNGYIDCNDYTMSFSNLSPSSLINNYFWDFGDLTTLADTSHLAAPTYTYPDTGVYTIKIVANRNQPCSDSTTAKVRVYPGFVADFTYTGTCINSPVQFTDQTNATYGSTNYWHWDFGVNSISGDTSRQRNPIYTYTNAGGYTVELIVGSDKGCRDTVYNSVTMFDKPAIIMAFRDTLICNVDTIQLSASGSGAIQWTPNYNIINGTSAAPLVYPKTTTWYKVEFNDNGCRNQDSVRVRVVNGVNLIASNDTSICANDPVQLNAITDGITYSWSPTTGVSNPNILNPVVTPAATTTYTIASKIGGCTAMEDVVITVVPRPFVNAGNDVSICYNGTTQLNAQTNGTSFTWSPTNSLSNTAVLNPIASPVGTTTYILASTNPSSGCAKPGYDTVIVTVHPEVKAFAGNDTVIIAGMPLQLKATGGVAYQWSPASNLNDPNIQGPIALLDGNPEYVTYSVLVTDQFGCTDTSSITIRVYKTGPDIFVPTGFTPNGDGRNDVFRPIYIGIKSVDYFRVYNRWGDLIYDNNKMDGSGWDGTIRGLKQNTGTFVWMVKAVDIIGNVHFKKGTITLVR